ncbi:MAG: hypothetical protein RSD06_05210 [Bacilli bacterium]
MKKILLLFSFFLLGLNTVNAGDCNKYGCATCKYDTLATNPKVSIIISLEGNGTGTPEEKLSHTKKQTNSYDKLELESKIPPKSYVADDTKKLKCPKRIYPLITGGMQGTHYTLYTDNKKTKTFFELVEEENNDLPITSAKELYSCTYKGTLIIPGGNAPDITIETDGKKEISYNFSPNAWKLSKSDLTADMFANGTCPDIYSSCGGSKSNLYCALSKENLSVVPKPPSEGNSNKDANELEKGYGSSFVVKDPNVDYNISIRGTSCKQILGQELLDWLQWVLDIVRIAALVLTIVFGITDFMSASFSSKEDGMKKKAKNFSTRLLALSLLFLIPTIVEFLLTLTNISSTGDNPRCGLN